jgi:RNA polymerase sigma-70 factor (ECF subfamily)
VGRGDAAVNRDAAAIGPIRRSSRPLSGSAALARNQGVATARQLAIATQEVAPISPEDFCQRYAAQVSRFAAFVAQPSEAEDIAQDALIKALRNLERFDAKRGSMDAWLWRIVVNTARDAQRRAWTRAALPERLRDDTASISAEDVALERVIAAELLGTVRRLPARDRELIALRFGADLDTAAVGAAVGLSAESARRAIGRALERVRVLIKEADHE